MATLNNMINSASAQTATKSVLAADLAGAGNSILFTAAHNTIYRIKDININFGGTNFSGGGGNRNIAITDGVTTYSVIPAATLQALVNGKWGDTNVPLPTSAAMDTVTGIGDNLLAVYSGGTTDYGAGSVNITVTYEFMGVVGGP